MTVKVDGDTIGEEVSDHIDF